MASAATAAHLLSSLPVASGLSPRPLPCRRRRTDTHRAEAVRSLSCRASLGSDGSLAALAAPRPAPPRGRPYLREHFCLIFPPPRGRRPLAVVKFLGGAFIGAVPEVTYGHLLELLAQEGFLVVSVPYNVTFDHEAAALEVFERFHGCYDALLASGLPEAGLSALDISILPLFSVGHSNGALLQLLVGSYFSEKIPKASAIVSFNNRPASEAVPYFEQIGPLFSQLMPVMEASPVYSVARNASGDVWKALFDLAGGLIREYDQEAIVSLSKFVDQLPSVINQLTGDLITDQFKAHTTQDWVQSKYNKQPQARSPPDPPHHCFCVLGSSRLLRRSFSLKQILLRLSPPKRVLHTILSPAR